MTTSAYLRGGSTTIQIKKPEMQNSPVDSCGSSRAPQNPALTQCTRATRGEYIGYQHKFLGWFPVQSRAAKSCNLCPHLFDLLCLPAVSSQNNACPMMLSSWFCYALNLGKNVMLVGGLIAILYVPQCKNVAGWLTSISIRLKPTRNGYLLFFVRTLQPVIPSRQLPLWLSIL